MSTSSAAAPRLPTSKDFPPSISLTITPPPNVQLPLNVLILLHGLGDTHVPFTRLAQQLNLPYTCVISLGGPTPVPALFTGSDVPSFHWGDDILFDQSTGELDVDSGFKASQILLSEAVIKNILMDKCGFQPRQVMLMGFGQGGMAALHYAASVPQVELGGIISIGGRLPAAAVASTSKTKTPVLVLGGSRSKQVTRSAVEQLKNIFLTVEYVKWTKAEDSMPGSRDEMLPIMRFFARRLRSRAGVPSDAVEIG